MPTLRSTATILCLCLAIAAPAAAQTGEVSGRVSGDGGAMIAAAEVVLEHVADLGQHRTVTDEAGAWSLSGVPSGTYVVRVGAMGYRAVERRVNVVAGQRVNVDLRLTERPVQLDGLVVSAARTAAPVATLPSSVTVVSRDVFMRQTALSPGLNGALAQVVPGLSAGTGTTSLFGQSFRGRNLSVLIDGVPQSTGRNVMRDLETIDASAIERVEVLRGATSVYGDGATGGVINIITRAPADDLRYTTSLSAEVAPGQLEDGTGTRLSQSVSGRAGAFDFLVSGSRMSAGRYYDGEGDLIPSDPQGQGGLADYRSWNVLGKLGARFGARRVELSVARYDGVQDTDLVTDPTVNGTEPGSAKARALSGLQLKQSGGSENLNVIGSYEDADVLGGRLRGQVYLRDYRTLFGPFDGRSYIDHVAQSFVDSRKYGARLELETPLPLPASVSAVWGVDYTDESSFQGLNLMDPDVYDESGGLVFQQVGEAKWVPVIDARSVGMFAQLAWAPVDRVSVRGGVRHERVRMHVDDFTTVTGNAIVGGDLDYTPVLLNLGAVFDLTSALNVFASYAQGFSLADIGRVLRGAPAGFTMGSKQLDAQLVDHYELGARAHWSRVQASASVFYNGSDLGTSFDANLDVIRAPERIRGFEASASAQVLPALDLGGTFTWFDGESYAEASDEWNALNGFRVQPAKVTAFVQHRTLPGWTNLVQILHSGSRDRAFEDGLTYGHLPVDGFTVADLLSSVEAGPGRVEIGVQNVFDALYFPVVSQLYAQWGNSGRAAARGRTLSVGYTMTY